MTEDSRIIVFDVLDSTNDYLKKHYHDYSDGSVIVAKMQTNGRGRFDRTWVSQDDLTFSLLFKNEQHPHAILVPVAIVQMLQDMGVEANIKWPNDIIVNNKKLAGILIETIYEGNTWVADVVGIGINLHKKLGQTFPSIGLLDVSKNINENNAVNELIPRFKEHYEAMITTLIHRPTKLQALMQMYRDHSLVLQRMVEYHNQMYRVTNIKDNGSLILTNKFHTVEVCSDEITLHSFYHDD